MIESRKVPILKHALVFFYFLLPIHTYHVLRDTYSNIQWAEKRGLLRSSWRRTPWSLIRLRLNSSPIYQNITAKNKLHLFTVRCVSNDALHLDLRGMLHYRRSGAFLWYLLHTRESSCFLQLSSDIISSSTVRTFFRFSTHICCTVFSRDCTTVVRKLRARWQSS